MNKGAEEKVSMLIFERWRRRIVSEEERERKNLLITEELEVLLAVGKGGRRAAC